MARQSEASIPVLVTRPLPEGERFAALLVDRFGQSVHPIVSPLIAPRYLTVEIPAYDYAAVVFTSAHAVEGAKRLQVQLPVLAWCVGGKTADAASAAGFLARSADKDAEALAKAISKDPPNGRILYLRGVDTHGNLPEMLENFGMHVDVQIVYAQDPVDLSPAAKAALLTPSDVIIPLFSPRTARLFLRAQPPETTAILHFVAMSAAVASELPRHSGAGLFIARHPDVPSMLDAVETALTRLPTT